MAATLNGNGTDLEKELEAQFRKMGNELRRRYEGDPWGLDALLEALEAQLPDGSLLLLQQSHLTQGSSSSQETKGSAGSRALALRHSTHP